jgi:DNA replication protein DnaC
MVMPKEPIKQIEYYAAALKAPRIRDSAARLAEQARDAGWTHEEYLAAVLSREISSRESSGAELRIRTAGFPGRKALEEFNFDHQPALKRDVIAHLEPPRV